MSYVFCARAVPVSVHLYCVCVCVCVCVYMCRVCACVCVASVCPHALLPMAMMSDVTGS